MPAPEKSNRTGLFTASHLPIPLLVADHDHQHIVVPFLDRHFLDPDHGLLVALVEHQGLVLALVAGACLLPAVRGQ